jgi:hypothetical protein
MVKSDESSRSEPAAQAFTSSPWEAQIMRNLLAFLGALIITLVVVGWFQNWFQFRTTANPDNGNRNLTIDINTTKVGDDLNKTEKNVQTFIEEKSKEVKTPATTQPATTQPAKEVKTPDGK